MQLKGERTNLGSQFKARSIMVGKTGSQRWKQMARSLPASGSRGRVRLEAKWVIGRYRSLEVSSRALQGDKRLTPGEMQ